MKFLCIAALACVSATVALASGEESMREFPVVISEIAVVDEEGASSVAGQTPVVFELVGTFAHNGKPVQQVFPWITRYEGEAGGLVGFSLLPVRSDNQLFGCRSGSERDLGHCRVPLGTISAEGNFEPIESHAVFAKKTFNSPPLWMKAFCLITSMCPATDTEWFEFGLKPTAAQ
jgi:hypothetical protein